MIEPYYGGSHRAWVDGYCASTRHHIELLTLPDQFWKWRMQGGAVTLARLFQETVLVPDLILVSDMMDVSLFRALVQPAVPVALYFHENQLAYPQNRRQSHGWRYGFINYASALAADQIYFNSQFHYDAFFDELPRMLKHFGDYNELDSISMLEAKADVLSLGLDLQAFDVHHPTDNQRDNETPLILWNHRWASEKNPTAFFDALYTLANAGYEFKVALAGENMRQEPTEFLRARDKLGDRIVHYGFAPSFENYAALLWQADYVISPSYQDFFGISVSEAIYCECVPLLADRLNFPHLIPSEYHRACLFREGALTGLLEQHLQGNIAVDTMTLRRHIAQYDWSIMAPQYDDTFESLLT